MLRGKRVVLRPVMRTDAKNCIKWFNDLEVTQYLLMYLPVTDVSEEKWIEDLNTKKQGTDVVFVIEVVSGKKKTPIGTIGLHKIDWKNRDAEMGIAIGEKKFWSNGYGTEATRLVLDYAFSHLNLHRVSSAAYDFNERSIGLQKKIGFVEEGRVRQSMYKKGKYCDKFLFGILREEWEKTKN